MYFKTTGGKTAIKLMLRDTLFRLGYKPTARIAIVNEE
jgi:hypothetical protein